MYILIGYKWRYIRLDGIGQGIEGKEYTRGGQGQGKERGREGQKIPLFVGHGCVIPYQWGNSWGAAAGHDAVFVSPPFSKFFKALQPSNIKASQRFLGRVIHSFIHRKANAIPREVLFYKGREHFSPCDTTNCNRIEP